MKTLTIAAAATLAILGLAACEQRTTEIVTPEAPAAPDNITVTPPDVNVMAPAEPSSSTTTTEKSTSITPPDPATGSMGSVTTTTTTENK